MGLGLTHSVRSVGHRMLSGWVPQLEVCWHVKQKTPASLLEDKAHTCGDRVCKRLSKKKSSTGLHEVPTLAARRMQAALLQIMLAGILEADLTRSLWRLFKAWSPGASSLTRQKCGTSLQNSEFRIVKHPRVWISTQHELQDLEL